MTSLQGHLLIASPALRDPNFARTVVLMAVHSDDGSLGLVLNRETGIAIKDIWSQVSDTPCARAGFLRQGGPVGGTLMAVHDQSEWADLTVADGVFVTSEKPSMNELASSDDGNVLFFAGNAGWGPGQLEMEMEEGAWLTIPATAAHVFGDHDSLWQGLLREIGRNKTQTLLGGKEVPNDPSLN